MIRVLLPPPIARDTTLTPPQNPLRELQNPTQNPTNNPRSHIPALIRTHNQIHWVSTLAAPNPHFGIADFGMDEHPSGKRHPMGEGRSPTSPDSWMDTEAPREAPYPNFSPVRATCCSQRPNSSLQTSQIHQFSMQNVGFFLFFLFNPTQLRVPGEAPGAAEQLRISP